MKRKSVKLIATTLLLSSLLSFTSFAAWEQSEAGWKYKDDITNVYVTATWIESTSEAGLWYYVGTDGIMATNTLIDGVYYVNGAGEWREGQTTTTNVVVADDNSPWTAEELAENPLRADYTRAEYNEIERKMNELGQTIGGQELWKPVELGENNGLLMDPEIVKGIGEGLCR